MTGVVEPDVPQAGRAAGKLRRPRQPAAACVGVRQLSRSGDDRLDVVERHELIGGASIGAEGDARAVWLVTPLGN